MELKKTNSEIVRQAMEHGVALLQDEAAGGPATSAISGPEAKNSA